MARFQATSQHRPARQILTIRMTRTSCCGKNGTCATDPNDPNDPNELLWKKWDVVIKDPNDPNEMLWAKWSAVVKVLQAEEITQIAKGKIIDKIVTPIFDFPLMAKLVLGRNNVPNSQSSSPTGLKHHTGRKYRSTPMKRPRSNQHSERRRLSIFRWS